MTFYELESTVYGMPMSSIACDYFLMENYELRNIEMLELRKEEK